MSLGLSVEVYISVSRLVRLYHLVLSVSDLGVSFATVTNKMDVDIVLFLSDGAVCVPAHKEAPVQGIAVSLWGGWLESTGCVAEHEWGLP